MVVFVVMDWPFDKLRRAFGAFGCPCRMIAVRRAGMDVPDVPIAAT
jgi:hypothetical protein